MTTFLKIEASARPFGFNAPMAFDGKGDAIKILPE
jgi:hypothetical protein